MARKIDYQQPPAEIVAPAKEAFARLGPNAPAEQVVAELSRRGVDATPEQVENLRPRAAAEQAYVSGQQPEQQSAEWTRHEQVSEPTEVQAQKLVDQTGSVDLAQQALDTLARREQPGEGQPGARREGAGSRGERVSEDLAQRKEEFAGRLGYDSFAALFQASRPARSKRGNKNWYLTADPQGGWVVWNDYDLVASGHFKSDQEAQASIDLAPEDYAG